MKSIKIISILLLMFTSLMANAHSVLKSSSPDDGQVITSQPENLELNFSKPVKLIKLELYDQTGGKVKMAFMLSARASDRFEIPLPTIKPSNYTVKWVAMGGDVHKMKGQFSFSYSASVSLKILSDEKKESRENKPQQTETQKDEHHSQQH